MPAPPGPVPKRKAALRRRNKDAMPPDKSEALGDGLAAPGDPKWHPLALAWYESLGRSGQSRFYEPSDWATAAIIAESISRELKPQTVLDSEGKVHKISKPPKGAALAAWLKAMTALMVTEGDRRRLRMELQRPQPAGEGDAGVSELDEYRTRIPGDAG